MSKEELLELRLGRIRVDQQPAARSQETVYTMLNSVDWTRGEATFQCPGGV